MANDVVQRIRNIHSRLSKGHKKIANIIVNNLDLAAYMTASRLGAQAGVSESTVVRFAYELGYEGYGELQRAIQKMLQMHLTPNQRIEFTKQRIGRTDILEKVMLTDIDKIRNTINNLDRDAFTSRWKQSYLQRLFILWEHEAPSLLQECLTIICL